jgi:hypothetical protein
VLLSGSISLVLFRFMSACSVVFLIPGCSANCVGGCDSDPALC